MIGTFTRLEVYTLNVFKALERLLTAPQHAHVSLLPRLASKLVSLIADFYLTPLYDAVIDYGIRHKTSTQ